MMHDNSPDEHRPIVLKGGVRVQFPSPTRAPRDPKTFPSQDRDRTGTTLIIMGMPHWVTKTDLLGMLDEVCPGKYDYFYAPIDFTRGARGFFFVNFVSHQDAVSVRRLLTTAWPCPRITPDENKFKITWAKEQGKDRHVDKVKNTSIMHPSVLDIYKPEVFSNGVRQKFPTPTWPISPPVSE